MSEHEKKFTEKYKNDVPMKRYFTIAGIVIVTACCIILFYFSVARYTGLHEGIQTFFKVLQPIIYGFVIAYLMNPIMKLLERHMLPFFLKHMKKERSARKTVRTIATLVALVVLVGIVSLIIGSIIPQLYATIMDIVNNLPKQISGVLDWANDITGGRYEKNIMGVKESGIEKSINDGITWLRDQLEIGQEDVITTVTTGVIGVGRFFVNIIIGIIVSVYILISKETFKGQTKKIIYAILKPDVANGFITVARKSNEIFSGFIIGKIIDSAIIGVICYVCVRIMQMPYPMLVSVIIGLTNVIPVFGPYIGAVPTVIIIFLTNPMKGIYFLIFVFILQQVDGNIIGPKILGDSTGLSSFWVVVAIVVGGGLFGFLGMLLGVPVVAVLYYLVGNFVKWLLRRKDFPEETGKYVTLDQVDVTKNNKMVYKTVEESAPKKKETKE